MKRTTAALLALAALVALAGCTADTAAPTSTATSSATPSATATATGDPNLLPVVPASLTEATTGVETVRIADAIVALFDPAIVLGTDDHAQLVPATTDASAYYGVIRTITLDPTTDAVALAGAIVDALEAAGWTKHEGSAADGVYLGALSSADDSTAWFVIIGGDTSVEGESVLSLQVAGPDLA
jgi:hypothetical protein